MTVQALYEIDRVMNRVMDRAEKERDRFTHDQCLTAAVMAAGLANEVVRLRARAKRVRDLEVALEDAERDFNKISTRMTMEAVNSVGNMIDHATARIAKARGYPLAATTGKD